MATSEPVWSGQLVRVLKDGMVEEVFCGEWSRCHDARILQMGGEIAALKARVAALEEEAATARGMADMLFHSVRAICPEKQGACGQGEDRGAMDGCSPVAGGGQVSDELKAALAEIEALKADNAALREALGDISTTCEDSELRHYAPDDPNLARKMRRVLDRAWQTARDAYSQPHPGAALLEEVRTLRAENERLNHDMWYMAQAAIESEEELATAREQVDALGLLAQRARDEGLEEAARFSHHTAKEMRLEAGTGRTAKAAVGVVVARALDEFAGHLRALKGATNVSDSRANGDA